MEEKKLLEKSNRKKIYVFCGIIIAAILLFVFYILMNGSKQASFEAIQNKKLYVNNSGTSEINGNVKIDFSEEKQEYELKLKNNTQNKLVNFSINNKSKNIFENIIDFNSDVVYTYDTNSKEWTSTELSTYNTSLGSLTSIFTKNTSLEFINNITSKDSKKVFDKVFISSNNNGKTTLKINKISLYDLMKKIDSKSDFKNNEYFAQLKSLGIEYDEFSKGIKINEFSLIFGKEYLEEIKIDISFNVLNTKGNIKIDLKASTKNIEDIEIPKVEKTSSNSSDDYVGPLKLKNGTYTFGSKEYPAGTYETISNENIVYEVNDKDLKIEKNTLTKIVLKKGDKLKISKAKDFVTLYGYQTSNIITYLENGKYVVGEDFEPGKYYLFLDENREYSYYKNTKITLDGKEISYNKNALGYQDEFKKNQVVEISGLPDDMVVEVMSKIK